MWTSRKSRLTITFFPPVWECGLIVLWKTTKNNVFRIRPLLNGWFDLLGRLNECRYPFLIVIIFMWTSPFICFECFSESFFPVIFNRVTLCFENGVVWYPRLCHNDSGRISDLLLISCTSVCENKKFNKAVVR